MDDDDENEQKITVPYLITAMIRKARELSPPSSPHHTCGYDILAKLVEVGKRIQSHQSNYLRHLHL